MKGERKAGGQPGWTGEPPDTIEVIEEPSPRPTQAGGCPLDLGPRLWAWLLTPCPGAPARLRWPTLTFWFDGTHWRASMHERGRQLTAFRAAETLEQLLKDLEHALQTETCRWRHDHTS